MRIGGRRHQLDLDRPGSPENYRALKKLAQKQPHRRLGFFGSPKPLRFELDGRRIKVRVVGLAAEWEELSISVWQGAEVSSYPGPRGFAELAREDPQLTRSLLEAAFPEKRGQDEPEEKSGVIAGSRA